MALKKIKSVEVESGTELTEPLPDGQYAVIAYSNHRVGLVRAPNPFPWSTEIYTFKDGFAEPAACGSSPGDMLGNYDVEKVFLIGLTPERRIELNNKLGASNIELISAE